MASAAGTAAGVRISPGAEGGRRRFAIVGFRRGAGDLNQTLFVQRFLGGDVAVVVAVPFGKFFDVLAAFAPFVEGDLAVFVGVQFLEPGGQFLGQLASTKDNRARVEILFLDDDGGDAGLISLATPALHAGEGIGLVFVEAN